ncbi:uncharacterized protein LOC111321069 isoform X2 [Stylophora pistillata]|uniref:uncharacterized protein LOC111321069 isoform X2 n=1 Tax=Stylophora pistillata TaxID=50429 RepID=UPI000C03FBA9|nr:uncharacterized protein LOC111321069 isoform X2 [Stylophora pistillata]
MARNTCTPFCDKRKPCPKHHDLLVAILECSDMRDKRGKMDEFEETVKSFLKKGWKRDEEIPDPVKNYRFPLLHWAGVLGKCRAMEWLIKNGFDPTVRSSDTQETALHRCILCLHYSNIRRLVDKTKIMIHLLKDCLHLQDKALQTPLHAAAIKLLSGNKVDFYEECLEGMVAKAKELSGKTAQIMNARDQHGNTALHYLAQKDIGLIAFRAIVNAGGDMTIKNNKKLTARDIAMNSGCTRIIKFLSTVGNSSRLSNRYDDSIYTTESPPESPLNDEAERECGEDEPSNEDDFSNDERSTSLVDGEPSSDTLSLGKDTISSNDVTTDHEDPEECEENVTHVETTQDEPSLERNTPEDAGNTDQTDEEPSNQPFGLCHLSDVFAGPQTSLDLTHGNENETPENYSNNDASQVDSFLVNDEDFHEGTSNAEWSDEDISEDVNATGSNETNDVPLTLTDELPLPNAPPGVKSSAPSDFISTSTPNVSSVGIITPPSVGVDHSLDVGSQSPHSPPRECRSTCEGVQMPTVDPYPCIASVKEEMQPCERCRMESTNEIASSSGELLKSVTMSDLASSMVSLLRGAGILSNITEIAEKTRVQGENQLADKLEMVKETNNKLETSEKEIQEDNKEIEKMLLKVEEMKENVKKKTEEREQLFLKRKRLNDECNALQKKLHCCDSLLKVVPKVNEGDETL